MHYVIPSNRSNQINEKFEQIKYSFLIYLTSLVAWKLDKQINVQKPREASDNIID